MNEKFPRNVISFEEKRKERMEAAQKETESTAELETVARQFMDGTRADLLEYLVSTEEDPFPRAAATSGILEDRLDKVLAIHHESFKNESKEALAKLILLNRERAGKDHSPFLYALGKRYLEVIHEEGDRS